MRYQYLAILALGIAAPALAQQAPSTNSTVAENAPDPSSIAAAKPVIDKLWPLGTYRRMMDGSMSKIMDSMIESMMGMKASDIVGPMDKSGKAAETVGGSSMGEVAAKADPNFRERMKLTMDAMMSGMIPIMEKIEPQVVENLTKIYARRFSTAQLADMAAFFATPSGKAYAEQSMLVFMDPEMIQGMQAFVPELMKSMPDIMKKAEAATKHLPPPPKPSEAK
jgi:Uncharacterized protein conserved in bacteria (DUF2059)